MFWVDGDGYVFGVVLVVVLEVGGIVLCVVGVVGDGVVVFVEYVVYLYEGV